MFILNTANEIFRHERMFSCSKLIGLDQQIMFEISGNHFATGPDLRGPGSLALYDFHVNIWSFRFKFWLIQFKISRNKRMSLKQNRSSLWRAGSLALS